MTKGIVKMGKGFCSDKVVVARNGQQFPEDDCDRRRSYHGETSRLPGGLGDGEHFFISLLHLLSPNWYH